MPVTAQLRVKTLDGEAITLRVLPTDTVASVKGKIQAFEGAGQKCATSLAGSQLERHSKHTGILATRPSHGCMHHTIRCDCAVWKQGMQGLL